MSSIPRLALNTRASKPGAIPVPSSRLNALARAITSCGSEISAGVILFNRSEEHTFELQSLRHLVCRLLLEKKKQHTHSHKDGARDRSTVRRAGDDATR